MPDRKLALSKYRRRVVTYDDAPRLTGMRRRFVARLDQKADDAVLVVVCGTGLNFPIIQEAIGHTGRLIGIDLSPDILVRAREKAAINGWHNVTSIKSSVDEAQIPEQVDAVLFSFAHDVLQSPPALESVMHYVKPSGRGVVSAGLKWAAWWAAPINPGVWYLARTYAATLDGYAQPWFHLAGFVSHLDVESLKLDAVYIAWGTKAVAPQIKPGIRFRNLRKLRRQ